MGADWQFQQDFRSNYDNLEGEKGNLRLAQNEMYRDFSLYSLNSVRLSSKWRGELNMRISFIQTEMEDHFHMDGDQSGARNIQSFNPALKFTYQLSKQMSANIIGSTGFESPTLTELSVAPKGISGFNTSLSSSNTRLYEVHLHYGTTNHKYIDIHLFHISGSNEIIPNEIQVSPADFIMRTRAHLKEEDMKYLSNGRYWIDVICYGISPRISCFGTMKKPIARNTKLLSPGATFS